MKIRRFSLAIIVLIVMAATQYGVSNNAHAAAICSAASAISVPFTKDGAGDFCWQTTSLCTYINSWNLTTLEVNGTSYLNQWTSGSAIPAVNGTYTIHYNSTVSYGHFEIGAPCSGGSPTNTPARTSTPGVGPTATNTARASNTPIRTATPPSGSTTYIFATFPPTGTERLMIYTSSDAVNFTLLSDTGYTGPTGFIRDPSIMKHTDGKYYIAFTTPPAAGCCGNEAKFSIASSSDLRTWTTVTTINAGVSGTIHTWAPEWFVDSDGSVNMLVSINTSAANYQTYKFTATNSALSAWSGPTAIGITPNHIDTFVVKVGGVYHAFSKNETTLYIEHATASSLTGPWTWVGTGNWAGWGTHREAPSLLKLDNGGWRIYVDGGSSGHEMYSDGNSSFGSWTALKALPNISTSTSHGTVIRQ